MCVRRLFSAAFVICTLSFAGCGSLKDNVEALGDSVEARKGGTVSGLLDQLRPGEDDLQAMVVAHQHQNRGSAGLAPSFRPAAVHLFVALELPVYLITPEGEKMLLTESVQISDLDANTLAVIPYEITYQDATFDFEGVLELRFLWDATSEIFVAAAPSVIVMTASDDGKSYIKGIVINTLLSSLQATMPVHSGMPSVPVMATVSPHDGDIYQAATKVDGTFTVGPLPGALGYAVVAAADGFYFDPAYVYVPEASVVEAVDFYLMPKFTGVTHTTQIYGGIKDLDGQAVAGAFVRVLEAGTLEPVGRTNVAYSNHQGSYMAVNIPADTAHYVIETLVIGSFQGQSSARSTISGAFVLDPQSAPEFFRKDLVFENHRPHVDCRAAGVSGENVSLVVAPAASVTLVVQGTDPDGDLLDLGWYDPHYGVLHGTGGGVDGYSERTYTAPSSEGYDQVQVEFFDGAYTVSCSFDITVQNSTLK